MGIGGALSNPNTVEAYPFLDVGWLQSVFTVMASAGAIVFANLAVLFAVGVAVGLAKSDKGTAGLASLIAYLVMNATINALLKINGTLATQNAGALGQGTLLDPDAGDRGVRRGGHRFGDLVSARPLQQDSAAAVLGFSAARALYRSSARWRRWRSAP